MNNPDLHVLAFAAETTPERRQAAEMSRQTTTGNSEGVHTHRDLLAINGCYPGAWDSPDFFHTFLLTEYAHDDMVAALPA